MPRSDPRIDTDRPAREIDRTTTAPLAWLQARRDWLGRYIDYGMAWKGALFLGVVVWLINLPHGPLAALPAALKQGTYTYFVAGFITRLCQTLAVRIRRRELALFLAVLIPSAIALSLTLLIHTLKGTPEPIRSTIPTLLTAPPAFFWWGRKRRRAVEEHDA